MKSAHILFIKYIRTLVLCCALAALCFGHVPKAMAAGEFQADYDVQYAVTPSGNTIVTQHVTLTNKLPNLYPTQYSLLLDSDKISNIIAYDDKGVVTPEISVENGKTTIKLSFNVKAVGLGNSMTFSLRYEHGGIMSLAGSIWELYIPGVIDDPDIGSYNVTLTTPPSIGAAAYLSPKPAHGSVWSKEQMVNGGIAAAFGQKQRFDVGLSYALYNDTPQEQIQAIAIPPETAYQEVVVRSLTPKPQTVERDSDGNWIAHYRIAGQSSLDVEAELTISTYLTARDTFTQGPVDTKAYLFPKQYWETANPDIKALAAKYTTPRLIYNYVANALSYDYDKVNEEAIRMGAAKVLKEPDKAVCMEFTDLFIAIARAAGIPARRMVGYAYTSNPKLRPLSLVSDVLHAWPEYFDRDLNLWIPVDPTWANTTGGVDYFTKLDFNHIVFAINGADSVSPYPAGYYKVPGKSGRDIRVEFSQENHNPQEANVQASVSFPDIVAAGSQTKGNIVITNEGGESAYNVRVRAVSQPGDISVDTVIPELLPYATKQLEFTGRFEHGVRSMPGMITVHLNDTLITKSFTVQPLYWLIGLSLTGAAMLAVGIGIIIRKSLWKRSKNK